ncbi:hypothetical protein PBI_VALIDUS_93 [Mycobacterium phage Validus]|uniref:Uncharacterized protein n=1 Tax=Mycobacterium phage Validus TaxID=1414747 RepID=V5UQX7_9CAUD|nr:hypothetical protein CC50_gp018 [Mycobacterium phage Validus]AHB79623.1 hypothetical protein PBI_VALIDUS_93 [Mycobacterium phage Validus]
MMADYSYADFVTDSAGVATPTDRDRDRHRRAVLVRSSLAPGEGFKAVGTMSEDGPTIASAGGGLVPWQSQMVSVLQERREVSFSFNLPRQHGGPPLWLAQLFGLTLTPAPPTVREAAVDVWDALRTLLRVLWAVLRPLPGRVGERVADAWFDAVYGAYDAVLSRWEALRAPYVWGRLPGPMLRTWDADFNLVSVTRFAPEGRRVWLRRIVAHVWRAVRHG